jgi:hypothetical protein
MGKISDPLCPELDCDDLRDLEVREPELHERSDRTDLASDLFSQR